MGRQLNPPAVHGGGGGASRCFPGEEEKALQVEVTACAKGRRQGEQWQVRDSQEPRLAGVTGAWRTARAGKAEGELDGPGDPYSLTCVRHTPGHTRSQPYPQHCLSFLQPS